MSYEEKYNEALERAKKLHDSYNLMHISVDEIEQIFPELAESEDERMLQEIKRYIKEQGDKPNGLPNGTVAVYDMIDWLEKQKEPKWSPSEGEMGVLYKLCYLSNQITDEDDTELTRLYQDLKREYFNGHSFENMFLNEKQKEQKPAESISQLTVQGKGVYKICPRCKERMIRDNTKVYTSMPPQYGYKCPKCGEIEFDTAMYDSPEMEKQKIPREEYLYHLLANDIITFTDYTYLMAKKPFDYECANIPQKDYTPVEQKPADLSEMMVHKEPYIAPVPTPMVADGQKLSATKNGKTIPPENYSVNIPLAEWSEEDERMLSRCIKSIETLKQFADSATFKRAKDDEIDWLTNKLKSLRPSWKPSEEQMEVLKDAVKLYKETHFERFHDRIVSLYEQLKKL